MVTQPFDRLPLIEPLSLQDFRRTWFGRRSFVHPGAATAFAGLIGDSRWDNLGELLAAGSTEPAVWSEAGGRFRSELSPPREALTRYEAGATLYFAIDIPPLRAAVEQLAVALRWRPTSVQISAFAAHRGGTRMHFDVNENFTVQIRGEKRWRVAENLNVSKPSENYVTGTVPSDDLASYAIVPLPDTMPPQSEELIVNPGDILYVPAGMWHETQCDQPSLSLNINYSLSAGSWVDLVTPLVEHLVKEASSLAELREAVAVLDPGFVFARPRAVDPPLLRRNPAARLEVLDATTVEISIPNRPERARLTVPASLVDTIVEIASRRGVFSREDLDASLLGALVEAGLLVGAGPTPPPPITSSTGDWRTGIVRALRRKLLRDERFRAYGAVEWDQSTDVAVTTLVLIFAALREELEFIAAREET